MGKSVNRVTLLGNVGADPEVKTTGKGVRFATFSLATNEEWRDRDGNKQEATEWHNCVVWNRNSEDRGLADVVADYVNKGDRLYVEGKIKYRTVENEKEGTTRYYTDIEVRDLTLLGGSGGGERSSGRREEPRRGGGRSGGKGARPAKRVAPAGGAKKNPFEDEDDDLPF